MESIADKIYPTLINKEENRELLSKVPYKNFCDLAIVYRHILREDKNSISSFIITDRILAKMHITGDELHILAFGNAARHMKARLTDIGMSQVRDLYKLDNKSGFYGATVIAYPNTLMSVSTALGIDKFYILPSSVEEVLITRSDTKKDALLEIVRSTNRDLVREQGCFLSDNIYLYDKVTNNLTVISE